MANVWQPDVCIHAGIKLPVLVFVYGGSNQFGEAEPYNMSGLSAFQLAVTVNFNYRTGPIGWMAFEEDRAAGNSTGNWGLLDIQSALRWVRREIVAFCGDPDRVAIHGQSSGGGLVELQYISPGAHGLFRGAISESGGLDAAPLNQSLANTAAVAATVGCHSAGSGGAVRKACMAALSPLEITNLTNIGEWGPVVDGVVIPADPMSLLAAGKVNPVSVILGAQTNDSQLFLFRDNSKGGAEQPNDDPDGDLRPLAGWRLHGELKSMVGRHRLPAALALYPPDQNRTVRNLHQLGRAQSDRMLCAARRRAKLFASARPGRAFAYRFNYWYRSNRNCTAVPNFHLEYMGAVHQDEVTFVMGQPNFMELGSCCGRWGLSEGAEGCSRSPTCTMCYDQQMGDGYAGYFTAREFAFAREIGSFWTNFSSGNPNSRTTDIDLEPSGRWPSAVTGLLVLDAQLPGMAVVEEHVNGDPAICALWDTASVELDDDKSVVA